MKITKKRLHQIIKEEVGKFLEGDVIDFQKYKQRKHLEKEVQKFVVLSDGETYSETEGSYFLFIQPHRLPEEWVDVYDNRDMSAFVEAFEEGQEISGVNLVSIGNMFSGFGVEK